MTMATCPAINCTYLDQYKQYLQEMNYWYSVLDNFTSSSPEPEPPPPPALVADADIAGLGVTTIHFIPFYIGILMADIKY